MKRKATSQFSSGASKLLSPEAFLCHFHQSRVEIKIGSTDVFDRVMLGDVFSRVQARRCSALTIVYCVHDGLGVSLRFVATNKPTSLTRRDRLCSFTICSDQLGVALRSRGKNRSTARHRLEHNVGLSLGGRSRDDNCASTQVRPYVGDSAFETDAIGQTERLNLLLESAAAWPIADQR